jgi:predicted dehydrogenase
VSTDRTSVRMINTAREIATRAHRGQRDKIGDPYIRHPEAVAALVQLLPTFQAAEPGVRTDIVAAGWLHDVIEDTAETADSLLDAGISSTAVEAVLALTRRDEVAEDEYYAGIAESPIARMVKIADIASNLSPDRTARLDAEPRERLAIKYAHALAAIDGDRVVVDALHDAAASAPRPVRLGVVGFGVRSSLVRNTSGGVEWTVSAVCDPSRRGRGDAQAAFPDALITADLETLLDADVDAVVVLAPDHLHEAIAVRALHAGVAVFCEKPLATTIEGCDAVLRAAYESGSRLYVGHNMRHMPVVKLMRELVVAGRIGAVQAIWCRHFVGHGGDFYFKDWHADRRNSTGLLLQKGAHDIDVIHYLAGAASTTVAAMGDLMVYGDLAARREPGDSRMTDWYDDSGWPPRELRDLNPVVDVEDLSMMIMRLENGVLASYQQCHFTPDYWRNYTIIGDQGRIENFGDGPGGRIGLWNKRHDRWAEPDESIVLPDEVGGHGGADPAMIAEFVRFVRSGGPTTTSPVSARHAVAAAVTATRSLRGDSSALSVPPLDQALTAYFAAGQLVD